MSLTESDDMQADTFREPVEPRKCTRHKWTTGQRIVKDPNGVAIVVGRGTATETTLHRSVVQETWCRICGKVKNETLSRRGRTSRNYGNRAELTASRKYGGTKVGAAGGPVDIRGKDFATQCKTHRRMPPKEWTVVFAKMAQEQRCPRLLARFVMGPGVPPKDYFVFEAEAFLEWFGKDE